MDVDAEPPPTGSEKTAYQVLEHTRTALEEIAAKMLFIKKEGKAKSELRELVTQASLHLITLRRVNRAILLQEDRVKAETEGSKAPVDITTLQLHNLMYEKSHYLKAIKACKDFKSKYPDIDLVPEEEFFADAPEDIKGGVLSSDGTHDLMLKRLNYELLQRKELGKFREKLEQEKKILLDNIASRKKFLSSLPSHLKSLKKASLPVQQQLGMLHTKKLKQQRAAELLPPPLFLLYSQLLAQKEAFEERIELEIIGSMKDAQAFALQLSNKDKGVTSNVENSIVEDDTPDDDDEGQRSRKRRKKITNKENLDHVGAYQSHPLNIILHVYDNENFDVNPSKLLTLRFEYLVKLHVVCVGIEEAGQCSRNNILCNLFPDDTGEKLPHQTAMLYAGETIVFDEKRSSRPFKWAQHLAGMDFLPELPPLLTSIEAINSEMPKSSPVLSGLSLYRRQNRVKTLLQRIRSRKKAQVALQDQLDSLANLRWPSLTYENVPWVLNSLVCALEQCSPAVTAEFDPQSSAAPVAAGLAMEPSAIVTDGKSLSWRDEAEYTREDGELPSAIQVQATLDNVKLTPFKGSIDPERSRTLALISKSVTPSKAKSLSVLKHEEDTDLILDNESDVEQQFSEAEKEDESIACCESSLNLWKDHGVRELDLILSRTDKEASLKLHARIKISMEYPLRPPYFSLNLTDGVNKAELSAHWYNELRAIESEVNLHILKVLPREYEGHTLAHQVCCLAMLFDFLFDQLRSKPETMKSSTLVDVGLCTPVTGKMVARCFRGRDRRKMFSWKDVECTRGYPY